MLILFVTDVKFAAELSISQSSLKIGRSHLPIVSLRQYQLTCGLQRLMSSFVDKLFTNESFEASHLLADNVDDMKDKRILMPDGTRYGETVLHELFFLSVIV